MSQKTKTLICFIAGLLFFFSAGFMVFSRPCPTSSEFLFIRLTIALALATISVILLGTIKFSHTQNSVLLQATGGFAVLALAWYGIPDITNVRNCQTTTDVSFIIRDTNSATIPGLQGKVSVLIGINQQDKDIDKDGAVHFHDLPTALLAQNVIVELKVNGWRLHPTHCQVINTLLQERKVFLLICPNGSLQPGINEEKTAYRRH